MSVVEKASGGRKPPEATQRGAFAEEVWNAVRAFQPQLVCFAGWLHLLPIPADFHHKVLNIHPSLLPAFGGKGMYGHHVHSAVLDYGAKVSGCTVHFADDTYDTGPILVQKCVPVKPGDDPDTLAARVFQAECEAYPEAIRLIAEGKVTVQGLKGRDRFRLKSCKPVRSLFRLLASRFVITAPKTRSFRIAGRGLTVKEYENLSTRCRSEDHCLKELTTFIGRTRSWVNAFLSRH